jgi:hypothetical protein
MRRILLSACLLAPVLATAEPAFTPLFNGRDLAGWKVPSPNPFWRVENGVLMGENDEKLKGSMLYTESVHRDFVLEAEVRFAGEIDSGIMVRKPELQMQIGVSRSLKRDMTGSFYIGNYPPEGQGKGVDALLRSGEWNRFRLQAKGDTFTVWLNDRQITEYTHAKYKGEGPIGLQIHGGLKMKVEFRALRLAPLP